MSKYEKLFEVKDLEKKALSKMEDMRFVDTYGYETTNQERKESDETFMEAEAGDMNGLWYYFGVKKGDYDFSSLVINKPYNSVRYLQASAKQMASRDALFNMAPEEGYEPTEP